jgi:hypothetical protein
MSKELKLLLISIGLLAIAIGTAYINQPTNCWDKYTTEHAAITNCEGK